MLHMRVYICAKTSELPSQATAGVHIKYEMRHIVYACTALDSELETVW